MMTPPTPFAESAISARPFVETRPLIDSAVMTPRLELSENWRAFTANGPPGGSVGAPLTVMSPFAKRSIHPPQKLDTQGFTFSPPSAKTAPDVELLLSMVRFPPTQTSTHAVD